VDSISLSKAPRINRTSRRIVITTWGSLGDLHPYVALALGLQSRGHEVILATGEYYRGKIEALGLGFRPVRPDCDWLADPVVVRRLMHQRWGMVRVVRRQLLSLRAAYEDTLAAAEGSDLLVGFMAAYATGIVAEKLQIPWASAMHIPTGLFSAYDPPLVPGFPGISKKLRGLGPRFWGPVGRSLNWGTRGLARPWHRLRKELGLPPARGFNPLTESPSPALHLALFSRWLANKQRDWPAQTLVTGFPWFDEDGSAGLPDELVHFLDDGEPPLVFTLGTAVVAEPREFYHQSVAAAKLLGRRAVLLVKNPRALLPDLPAGVVAFDYAPFSQLFPRAAAIIHHGGICTTGQAMRSGLPALVMPCAWDQPDNAERAVRLGIARTIARNCYDARRVAAELKLLLEDPAYSTRVAEIATKVRQEDGVLAACDALEAVFQRDT
jgi:rhamnosyltransferase subunit B